MRAPRLLYPAVALLLVLTPRVGYGQFHDSLALTTQTVPVPSMPPAALHGVSQWLPSADEPLPPLGSPSLFPKAPDHRYEGAVIGAILFGGLAAFLAEGFCEKEKDPCFARTVRAGLAFGFAGGVAGLLIGGAIPKGSSDAEELDGTTNSVRVGIGVRFDE